MTVFCVPLLGCGDKGDTTTTGDEETGAAMTTTGNETGMSTPTGETSATEPAVTTTEPGDTTATPTTEPMGETAANGEPCMANGDCMSLACEKFRDLEMGTCVEGPGGGNTRVMGTLVDFITLAPIADTEMRVLGALTAIQDPVAGTADLTAMSDANGQLDATSTAPFSAAFGEVAIVQGGDYYTTATGIAAPLEGVNYGPMNGNHDMWAVPSVKVTEWSTLLLADPEFMDSVPLGEKGGVIGFVRDRTTGMGVAGKKIIGADDGMTDASIRYLNDDGLGFNPDMTGTSGIFVLVNPGLAEQFAVEGTDTAGSAGSALNAVFVLILSVDA